MTTIELCALLMKKDPTWKRQVIVASDEEGNSYGTLDPQSISVDEKSVILYPWQTIEIDELE